MSDGPGEDAAERDFMSDALDLVVDHATSARELCEVGEAYHKAKIRLHLMQACAALQSALDMLGPDRSIDP